MSDKVKCVQPYLLALLQLLGSTLDERPPLIGSPAKGYIVSTIQVINPGADHRPKPTAVDNYTIGVTSGCIFMFGDDGTKVAVKEKAFRTVSRGPESLIRAGSGQVLGPLSEHVGVGFNFAGRGIDNQATGFVLTPACVKILRASFGEYGNGQGKTRSPGNSMPASPFTE